MSGKYDDMLHMPHHVSPTRPRMSMIDRAAQFSPFAALTGYEDAVRETARLTDHRIELDEAEKSILDEKLRLLAEQLPSQPEVSITYFQPDTRKAGSAYPTVTGTIKKIDEYKRILLMIEGTKVPIDDILKIESKAFVSPYNLIDVDTLSF